MLLIVPLSGCPPLPLSDPAPPRLTQPLSSRLFLACEDDEAAGEDGGGGAGDADYEKN